MTQHTPDRRFQIAQDKALADWAAVDPARCAALAGCQPTPDGILAPFFGRPYLVTHPQGIVETLPVEMLHATSLQADAASPQKPAHISIQILLLHYLLTADGVPPADRWLTFRELPDGLFYAQAFAGHAEGLLAERFGEDLEGFRRAAGALGGSRIDLADAAYRFQALPRLAVAVLIWQGDEDFPAQARVLFDAHAGHYLPTEDLSGLGDWLAHRLTR